jgi:hypothetical protein
MAAKEVKFSVDARDRMLHGIDILAHAVRVTSLVMRGAPNDLSSTTLRPLGPSGHQGNHRPNQGGSHRAARWGLHRGPSDHHRGDGRRET